MTKHIAGSFRSRFFPGHSPADFLKDALGGIIVALVSIPISMGYAQIAGLPMQYGLYGSVLPIFLFGLLSTSRDFVFGVDAAPAALAGTALASLGITAESGQAMQAVPLLAFMAACWLLLFFLVKAGRIVQYISEPVMGGFVSGICCTIILMQAPKLFGGSAGIGEAPELIRHLIGQLPQFNAAAFGLGAGVIAVLVVSRHLIPKIPMSVIAMAGGIAVTLLLPVKEYGVQLLPSVEAGYPLPSLPFAGFDLALLSELLFDSLSIAAVILAESLLASKSNAAKDGYRLQPNREILGYAAANFAASLTGCCPVNGSVSRSGIVRQFGVKSQWMSVFAAAAMLAVLYVGTPLIALLPVPILTAIVISALSGACEFGLAVRLFKASKREFFIFMAAFLGVLIFGTVYGVIIGIVLSFFTVIVRSITPPRSFLGVIPGKEGFYPLERSSGARAVKGAVIYRFGGNLFFANAETLSSEIMEAVKEDTNCVIVSGGAVGSIDLAAAGELLHLYKSLQKINIRFYLTDHIGQINDSLRRFGAGELIRNGAVRMTTTLALRDAGFRLPYETESPAANEKSEGSARASSAVRGLQAELEWALGADAEAFMQAITEEIYQAIKQERGLSVETVSHLENLSRWGRLNLFDEDELLDRLETRLLNRAVRHPDQGERIEAILEERRHMIEERMRQIDPAAVERIRRRRLQREQELYQTDREAFMQRRESRLRHLQALDEHNPALAEQYRRVYQEILDWSENASQPLSKKE